MVHFLGIFGPDHFQRRKGAEAPDKANFFGGLPDVALGAVPMSRAEQDACFLAGKAPAPDEPTLRAEPDGKTEK